MPSDLHETLIRLFRDAPDFAATLLCRQPEIHARGLSNPTLISENASVLKYAERRIDSVISFDTVDDLGLIGAIEVQLGKKESKRFSWPTYLARLREDTRKPVVLLVICGTDSVAKWAGEPIPLGPGSVISPIAVGPADIPCITDPDTPEASPEMAALSAIIHSRRSCGLDVLNAMDVVFSRMSDQERAVNYTEYVRSLLSGSRLKHLEALLSTATFPYHNAFTQRYVDSGRAEGKAQGRAEGKAEGKAEAKAESILTVLNARGIAVSQTERDRITACTDPTRLDTWLTKAVKVDSTTELFS
ncbi:hypothetical protein FB566_1926 [Stackebrandtia endophytica]|uniref:Transposase YdaD n=1 Tax=Stackebrandtia endophytica TaxID=1496996 RepID=A0A543AUY0_9ACTN|nr:hypothetical protein [Stackebrandtia endophytica]TQL76398.1 hypothetical protein FB566_1926 [Stackebrandtia endophytica]